MTLYTAFVLLDLDIIGIILSFKCLVTKPRWRKVSLIVLGFLGILLLLYIGLTFLLIAAID